MRRSPERAIAFLSAIGLLALIVSLPRPWPFIILAASGIILYQILDSATVRDNERKAMKSYRSLVLGHPDDDAEHE